MGHDRINVRLGALHEQQYIAYAVDSAISERAGVFIGAGVSGS